MTYISYTCNLHKLQTPLLHLFGAPKILLPWSLQLDWAQPPLFRLRLITKKVLMVVSGADVDLISLVLAVLPFYLFEDFFVFFFLMS